jgi:hypothetical protein
MFALEIQQERSLPIDLVSATDADELVRRIRRLYDRGRRANVSALSLDWTWSGPDGEQSEAFIESIPADDQADPVEALLQEQGQAEQQSRLLQACADSYSQSSAYVILLFKFDDIRSDLAAYLALGAPTLDRRIHWASRLKSVQPSLFDRIVTIARDFMPPQRFPLPKLRRSQRTVVQIPLFY